MYTFLLVILLFFVIYCPCCVYISCSNVYIKFPTFYKFGQLYVAIDKTDNCMYHKVLISTVLSGADKPQACDIKYNFAVSR